jgi:dTDP-4-dehydrorhamnose 3,5-epimerase
MKLNKPIVFNKIINIFDDKRGFLSSADLDLIFQAVPNFNFKPIYQLMSFSTYKNTFRGMHYQKKPFSQNKLIIIHQGEITDIAVEIESPKVKNVMSFQLSAGDAIFIPENFAHGFVTKTDDVLMQYIMDQKYSKENYKVINCNNYLKKAFPNLNLIISDQDKKKNNVLI